MIKMPNPSKKHPASAKAPNEDLKNMDVLFTYKIQVESQMWIIGVSKTSNHIQIKIKRPKFSQDPPDPTKAPNQDLKDMDVLCTLNQGIGPKFGS